MENTLIHEYVFLFTAAKCPLGQLPVLEVDGKLICQSNAIYRYVAREFGFYGDTSCEKGRIDQISETVVEIVNGVIPIMFGGHDEEAKVGSTLSGDQFWPIL